MATLAEQRNLWGDPDLIGKVEASLAIKAAALLDGTPSVAQRDWAVSYLSRPSDQGDDFLRYLIGTNSTLTVAQITGATDAAIQAAVDNAVDAIIGAV